VGEIHEGGFSAMEMALAIVQHTPIWVFAILAVLVATGVQALRPRVVPIWRLLIVPGVFIVWGVIGIAQRAHVAPAFPLEWAGAVAIGMAIGWSATRLTGMTYDPARQVVGLPGSPFPLVRSASIFIARYGLAVAAAFAAARSEYATIVRIDVAVSGLATGYFLGWLVRFVRFIRTRTDSTRVDRRFESIKEI
jgi:hypothetical protein